jgi:hypothetical protein
MRHSQALTAIAATVGTVLFHICPVGVFGISGALYLVEVHGSLSTGLVITVRHPYGREFVIERVKVVEGTPWPPPTVPGQAPWPTYVPPRPKLYWVAEGQSARGSFHSIRYGHPPEGLETKLGPEPLVPRKLYSVWVDARWPKRPLFGPLEGHGSYEFELDEHGVVKEAE